MTDAPLLFDDFALDTGRRELRWAGERVALGPQVFDLLVFLVENRDRVVSKDDMFETVWKGRIVSESTLTSHIKAVRVALGDSGAAQRLVRTVARKGIRFVGEVRREAPAAVVAAPAPAPSAPDVAMAPAPLEQRIAFCRAADGVRLAYATVGSGPPIVKTANWLNHLEYDWESPIYRGLFRGLARDHTLIRYDARGNGLSDWDAERIDFDAFVSDLEAVIDAAGLARFPLFCMSQGCAVAIAYAARHPERVSHLILHGGFAVGPLRRSPEEAERTRAMMHLIRTGWGTDNPAFRQLFTSLFFPDGGKEVFDSFNELQRVCISPDNAFRIREAVGNIDVRSLLAKVTVPTLVTHSRGDAVVPYEQGRAMASEIPGARFVTLQSKNHALLDTEPAHARLLNEIRSFLAT